MFKKWHKKVKEKDQLYLRLFQEDDGVTVRIVDFQGNQTQRPYVLHFKDKLNGVISLGYINRDFKCAKGSRGELLVFTDQEADKFLSVYEKIKSVCTCGMCK